MPRQPTPDARYGRVLSEAEALVKVRMASYDPSHDWLHVDRVRRTALALARSLDESVEIDWVVLELAALFHDLTDAKYSPSATTSSVLAPFFSSEVVCSPAGGDVEVPLISLEQGHLISRIVDAVSWSKEKKLRALGQWDDGWRESSIELACIQDADRLDAIGGFGIMRCCAYSAACNRALYIPLGEEGQPNTAIQHFHDKLFRMDSSAMKTPLGKTLAVKRQALMKAFVDGVEEEYALLGTM